LDRPSIKFEDGEDGKESDAVGTPFSRTSTRHSRRFMPSQVNNKPSDATRSDAILPSYTEKNRNKLSLRRANSITSKKGGIDTWYEIERPALQEGAFGTVYRATKKDTQQICVVKSIPFPEEDTERTYFERELAVSRRLKHPNIIRLHDSIADEEGLSWHLVMDFCAGGDLFDWAEKNGGKGDVGEATLARYAVEMLRGIQYCHYHYFCHRDIKPENYMLESKDSDACLKLIDFGLACEFSPGVFMSDRCGTTQYASPEVMLKSYTEKCDIWSIGVVFYMICIGRWPFFDKDEEKLFELIESGPDPFSESNRTKNLRWRIYDGHGTAMQDFVRELLVPEKNRPNANEILKSNQWLRKSMGTSNCCTLL